MPRPVKYRCVESIPRVRFFQPVGVPSGSWEEVVLSIEEAEAIRLKDLEGLGQEEGAQRMHISRPTFQRVLEAGRRKAAEALTLGKAIRVDGGNFEMARRRFKCDEDGQEWDVTFETMVEGQPLACPQCHSLKVRSISPPSSGGRGGRRGRRRMGGW
jgi:predicted DNA-binding protein (UPF0251 family)